MLSLLSALDHSQLSLFRYSWLNWSAFDSKSPQAVNRIHKFDNAGTPVRLYGRKHLGKHFAGFHLIAVYGMVIVFIKRCEGALSQGGPDKAGK